MNIPIVRQTNLIVRVNVADQPLLMNAAYAVVMALQMGHVIAQAMLMPVVVAAKLDLLAVIMPVVLVKRMMIGEYAVAMEHPVFTALFNLWNKLFTVFQV